LTCVPRHVVVENVQLLQPLCAAGHFALNFRCITCFEAAALGHVTQHNLPQPADIDSKWEWVYGCKWRCLHAAGYWELRPTAGTYWECVNTHMYNELVRGVDLSWTAANTSTRRVVSRRKPKLVLVGILWPKSHMRQQNAPSRRARGLDLAQWQSWQQRACRKAVHRISPGR